METCEITVPVSQKYPHCMAGEENEATHLEHRGIGKRRGRENAREGKGVDGGRSDPELHRTGERGGNFKKRPE